MYFDLLLFFSHHLRRCDEGLKWQCVCSFLLSIVVFFLPFQSHCFHPFNRVISSFRQGSGPMDSHCTSWHSVWGFNNYLEVPSTSGLRIHRGGTIVCMPMPLLSKGWMREWTGWKPSLKSWEIVGFVRLYFIGVLPWTTKEIASCCSGFVKLGSCLWFCGCIVY